MSTLLHYTAGDRAQTFVRSNTDLDKLAPFQCEHCGTASEQVRIDNNYLDHFNHRGEVINRILINCVIEVWCHGQYLRFADQLDVARIRAEIMPMYYIEAHDES